MSIVLVVFPAAPKPSPEAQRADRELDDTLRTRITGCYHSLLHACAHKHRHHPHLDLPSPDVNAHTLSHTLGSGDNANTLETDSHSPSSVDHAHTRRCPDMNTHTLDIVAHPSDVVAHISDTMAHIPHIDADTSDTDSKSDTCDTNVGNNRNLPNEATG